MEPQEPLEPERLRLKAVYLNVRSVTETFHLWHLITAWIFFVIALDRLRLKAPVKRWSWIMVFPFRSIAPWDLGKED
jgi:hypothetical protein